MTGRVTLDTEVNSITSVLMKRKFTFDDVLNAAGLGVLSNAELEALCDRFGVEA